MTCPRDAQRSGARALHVAIGIALATSTACGGDGGVAPDTGSTGSDDASTGSDSTGPDSTGPDSSGASVDTTTADTTTAADTTTGSGVDLLDEYLLDGDDMFPEGVAYDPVSQAFFVGSLTTAGITRVEAIDGAQSVFIPSSETATSSAGMKVDADARRLWVCGSDDAETSRIYIYGIDDGSLVETTDLGPLIENASCNDLALDAEGTAYVTDPRSSSIHRIAVGGDASVWVTDPEFAPELMDLGLNGIAVTPDDTAVIVTKFISKRLLRVAKDDPTQVSEIALSGEAFTGGALIAGPDGIVFGGDDVLYVVFDDVVAAVVFDAEWTAGEVTILTPPTAGLSTATMAEGEVYAVKSEVTAFALGTAPELPFRIVRVPMRASATTSRSRR